MRARTKLVSMWVVMLSCGCTATRTPYQRPPIVLPSSYAHAAAAAAERTDRWWQNFGDSDLDALVEQAFKRNNDIALAVLNLRSAQLQAHLAVINPTVSVGYTHDYTKPIKGAFAATQFHSLTASAAYEVDIWDQLGALNDAAQWEARATEQDRQNVALALAGAAVSLYYQIAALNQRIGLGAQSIAYAGKTLELVKVLASAGGAAKLDIVEAVQSLEAQEAAQTHLIEQRVETRNALTVLLNGSAWPEGAERMVLPDTPPPSVAAGLPVLLLERRPDVRAAEMRLREALAQSDAMRVSFYPTLSLTGSLGAASTGLSELVANPLASLAVVITAPFIQFNEAKFATALARIEYDKAAINFRKTLLQALIDVDNALSSRTQLADEGVRLERSLEAARTAEHLNEVRYRAGAIALRSWLDAQEIRRQAEVALAENRLGRLQNYAMVCQALGGKP
jgi:NodT family efflux transporter outer membrane factor (OMF) lipoprotein